MYELKLVLIHAGRWLPLMTAHKSFKKCLLVFTTSNQLQFSPIFFVSPLDLIRNGHQPKVVLIIAGRWLPLMTPHKSFSNSVFWTKNPTRRWLVLGGQPDWPLRWLPKSKNITTMLLRSMTLNFFLYTSHWWPVCKGYQKKCCKFCDTPFIRVEYTPTPNTVNFHWTVDDAFESEPKGFWSASTYYRNVTYNTCDLSHFTPWRFIFCKAVNADGTLVFKKMSDRRSGSRTFVQCTTSRQWYK